MGRVVLGLSLSVLMACAAAPASPVAPEASGEPFHVTGVVIDDRGAPLAGAEVAMAHWLEGRLQRPSVVTGSSGTFNIGFTADPWVIGTGGARGAARAEIKADGYELYWRTVLAGNSEIVENFRLSRGKRITAGESIELSSTLANGDCVGWLVKPCARVSVVVPSDGTVTIESIPMRATVRPPQNEVCCVGGNETGGNPVTIPVATGVELRVEVSFDGPVIVKTAFEPAEE